LKTPVDMLRDATDRWVGEGFPVFSHEQLGEEISPFFFLEYGSLSLRADRPAARRRSASASRFRNYEGEVTHQAQPDVAVS
jgi:hypothetical protein